jgi:hypothetical protein
MRGADTVMTPDMLEAARLLRIWGIAREWNCKAWEVGKRPASEYAAATQLMEARGKIAKEKQLHEELQEELEARKG